MAGRPSKFETPEQLQVAIDQYFKETAPGKQTVTGIALWLGFESRQSFYDYEQREEYSYMIKEARLRVENDYELTLRSTNVTGSIFALKNMGWKDKVEQEISGKDGSPIQIIQLPSNGRDNTGTESSE